MFKYILLLLLLIVFFLFIRISSNVTLYYTLKVNILSKCNSVYFIFDRKWFRFLNFFWLTLSSQLETISSHSGCRDFGKLYYRAKVEWVINFCWNFFLHRMWLYMLVMKLMWLWSLIVYKLVWLTLNYLKKVLVKQQFSVINHLVTITKFVHKFNRFTRTLCRCWKCKWKDKQSSLSIIDQFFPERKIKFQFNFNYKRDGR